MANHKLSETTAVILAGGLGTRLKHIYPNHQKVTVEVNGRPFLDYVLGQLVGQVQKAVLCVGHLADQVKATYGESFQGLELSYSEEVHLLGTAGALRLAYSQISSENILVLNGDTYCDADLKSFYNWHIDNNSRASIFLAQLEDTRRSGRVSINSLGQIVSFEEKGATTGPGLINAGIYLLARELICSIPKGHQVSLEREVFPALIGSNFYGYAGKYSRFIDIGTPESIGEAQSIFKREAGV